MDPYADALGLQTPSAPGGDPYASALGIKPAKPATKEEPPPKFDASDPVQMQSAILKTGDKGLIDAEQTVRVWIITPDDRLCDICEAIPTLNPDGVGLDEPFLTPEGPVDDPPAHPRCRCATGLEFTAADEAAAA